MTWLCLTNLCDAMKLGDSSKRSLALCESFIAANLIVHKRCLFLQWIFILTQDTFLDQLLRFGPLLDLLLEAISSHVLLQFLLLALK